MIWIIIYILTQCSGAISFLFLTEDTSATITVSDQTTIAALKYDFAELNPEYCVNRLRYFTAGLIDTFTRDNHICARFGAEYNLFRETNNEFIESFKRFCTKITNVKLFQDDLKADLSPSCELNLYSLNLMQERLENLANLIASFTYWDCSSVAETVEESMRRLSSQQLGQHFQLLYLTMKDIIKNFQEGLITLNFLSNRNQWPMDDSFNDCLLNSKPISQVEVNSCYKKDTEYICLVELSHNSLETIPTYQAITYNGYHLQGGIIGKYKDTYGSVHCQISECTFFPYSPACSTSLTDNNTQSIILNCPFEAHTANRDVLETPLGLLIQNECKIIEYDSSDREEIKYDPPILLSSGKDISINCEGRFFNYTGLFTGNIEIQGSVLSGFDKQHIRNHFLLKHNIEGLGLLGLYVALITGTGILVFFKLFVRFRTYLRSKRETFLRQKKREETSRRLNKNHELLPLNK